MAHSTRKKEKATRGGKTRNQEFKAKRRGEQEERLRNVVRWEEERILEQAIKKESKAEKTTKKVVKSNMLGKTVERRSKVLIRLTNVLEKGTKVLSTKQIIKIPQEQYLVIVEEASKNRSNDLIIPLTIEDKVRIEKEIATLKSRGATLPKTQPISSPTN